MHTLDKRISIGIVDDDKLVVELLAEFLNRQPRFQVTVKANGGQAFVEQVEQGTELPDVLLLDLRMKGGNGLETLEAIRQRSWATRIVVLSTFYRVSFIGQMLKQGVSAFLPKEIDQQQLVEVILTVGDKGHYFTPDQLDVLRDQVSAKVPKLQLEAQKLLSEREIEVLELLCQQCTTQEIAERLFISPKTVESHKGNLLVKTGVKNSAGLVVYAIQQQIVDPQSVVLFDDAFA